MPAGAPVISSPQIDPDTVERGSQDFSTVTAGIETSGTPGVCVLVLQGIYNHTPLGVGVGAYATLYDDGTTGDETAGDGIFTNDTLYAVESIEPGPRTLRIKAEIQDANGFRYAMAVDLEPFAVT